ncbi:MAG: hypothetical protein KH135_01290 [Firmicutes bacterium]|nr:hypothetical protein [Bacillota bacterium]
MSFKKKVIPVLLTGILCAQPVSAFALTKEETVYSKLKPNGTSYKTIVNEHLINEEKAKELTDKTNLSHIKNINGNETFKQVENQITWQSNGNDIYYQGETNEKLPIEMKIRYELDGKEISYKKLAGKSGTLKMTISMKNLTKEEVIVNGKKETIYTPFAVASVFYINNKNLKSVKGEHVKIVDDGTKTMFLGVTFPGLKESLGVDKLDIPEKLTLTMDVKNFEMGNIITVATPNISEFLDISKTGDINALYQQLGTLNQASQTILSGAKELNQGLITYHGKNQEFQNALGKITTGATMLNTKYSELDEGLRLIDSKVEELVAGADKINQGVKGSLGGITLPDFGSKKAELNTMYQGQLQLTQSLNTLKNAKELEGTYYQNLSDLIEANENLLTSLPADTDETVVQNLKNQISQEKQILAGLITNQQTLIQGLEKASDSNQLFANGTSSIITMIDGMPDVNGLLSNLGNLANGCEELYQGSVALKEGLDQLVLGSSEVKKGINELQGGLTELYQAQSQLVDATNSLKNGSSTLESGINTFHHTGIAKINRYVNQGMKNLQKRVEKLLELSDKYQTYTQKNDTDKGTIKFVFLTDSIKK